MRTAYKTITPLVGTDLQTPTSKLEWEISHDAASGNRTNTAGRRPSQLGNRIFYGSLSPWRYCGAALFYLESSLRCDCPMVDIGKPRHRYGLSSATHASCLQDSEVGRVFSDRLCDPHSRRRSNLLGGYAPHSSSVRGSGN